jgi:hypothetical protein
MAQHEAYDWRPASPTLCEASEWSEEFFATRLDALKAEGRYRECSLNWSAASASSRAHCNIVSVST